jgi:EmrB/QacA subfamily drug resistance transporter
MTPTGTRRWWALGAISLAVLAITLDVTVLTVALPTLAGALKASESQLQWFVTAYTLALVAGMLPAGLLGDRYGRKAVMVCALVLFAAGSAGCAFAPNAEVFIAARVLLGLAGAAMIVLALSIVTVMFDEAERPRAVGIWGAANFIGLPLGPILGGWILSNAWWGWIFLMNVPVALVGLIAVVALVPESRSAKRPSIDFGGVILSSAGLVAVMYGVVQAGSNGWGSLNAILPALVGLVALAGFVLWERRLTERPGGQPLVDLSLFGSRSFTWGIVLSAFGVFGLFGVMFALPQYFQAIMGLDPQGSGLRLLPVVGGLIIGAVTADRVAARAGAKLTVAAGFALVVAGLALGTTMTATSGDRFMALWTLVVGAGAGLGFATAASAALVELSAERSGVGSALLQAVIKLGPAFGASILGSVLNSTYGSRVSLAGLTAQAAATVKGSVFGGLTVARQLNSPELLASVRTAFVAGMDDAVRVAAVVAIAAVLLALAFLPGRIRAAQIADAPRVQTGRVSESSK